MAVSPEVVVIIGNSDLLGSTTELLSKRISRHPSFQARVLSPTEAISLIADSRQNRQPVAGVIIADIELGFRYINGIVVSEAIRKRFGRLPPIAILIPEASMARDQQAMMRSVGVNFFMGTKLDDAEVSASLVSFNMIARTLSGGRDHTSILNRHFERYGLHILTPSY